jgi:toxin ParE1/3/4
MDDKSCYELSEEADRDLQEIYDFTIENFGSHQAIEYLTGLETIFNNLCKHPYTGRSRNEIRRGLRCIAYVSHIIFYRMAEKRIRIVRVLHASRDLPKFL